MFVQPDLKNPNREFVGCIRTLPGVPFAGHAGRFGGERILLFEDRHRLLICP